jgi:hypothetical protein
VVHDLGTRLHVRYNHDQDGVYDIFGDTDEEGIKLWLYNYCHTKPLRSFSEAIDALITALYPSRLARAPR